MFLLDYQLSTPTCLARTGKTGLSYGSWQPHKMYKQYQETVNPFDVPSSMKQYNNPTSTYSVHIIIYKQLDTTSLYNRQSLLGSS